DRCRRHSFPTRRSSDLAGFTMNYLYDEIGMESLAGWRFMLAGRVMGLAGYINEMMSQLDQQIFSRYSTRRVDRAGTENRNDQERSEEHTSELQSRFELV